MLEAGSTPHRDAGQPPWSGNFVTKIIQLISLAYAMLTCQSLNYALAFHSQEGTLTHQV